ncbi:MAG: electron transport complex subunit RsxE [Ignavibacteriales bacterium]
MNTILNGIIKENPVFVLILGLCPALAITTKFENAYIMGICLMIVLLFSNFVISLIKKIIPDNLRMPIYLLVIGIFVTIVEFILGNYAPDIKDILGIYLPLIVVNCIILGRVMDVASKKNVGKSILDAIEIGIGYTLALILIAFIRETIGLGTITLMDSVSSLTGYRLIIELPTTTLFPINIMAGPAGAYITLAFLVALFTKLRGGKAHESN